MLSLIIVLIILVILAMIGRKIRNRDPKKKIDNKVKDKRMLGKTKIEKPTESNKPKQPEQVNTPKPQPIPASPEESAPKEKKQRVPFYMAPGFESGESGPDLINGIPW